MLRIGIVGHRVLTDNERIEKGIHEVLRAISTHYSNRDWVILSSLAEGADCWFAKHALQIYRARLIVPLPMSVDEYIKYFSSWESVELFQEMLKKAEKVIRLPNQTDKEIAYLEAGKYILANSDILVAIWDGQAAQGRGGTGEIVQLARQQGLPLAWILAGNRQPGTLEPTSLNEKQGKVVFEGFPFL